MNLQQQLDDFKAVFVKQAPAAAIEAFERSTYDLVESGQAERALKVGDKIPDFNLADASGNRVSSSELLANGPVVLTFYRGVWCPYCNIELKALETVKNDIESRGAQLVAVSMQSAENSLKSQRDNNLSYPILTDYAGELADKFGIRWTLQDYVIEFFKMFKVDLPTIHSDGQWALPMPARYVVAQDGTIAYSEVNPDYTHRPEPSDMFPVLDRLVENAAA